MEEFWKLVIAFKILHIIFYKIYSIRIFFLIVCVRAWFCLKGSVRGAGWKLWSSEGPPCCATVVLAALLRGAGNCVKREQYEAMDLNGQPSSMPEAILMPWTYIDSHCPCLKQSWSHRPTWTATVHAWSNPEAKNLRGEDYPCLKQSWDHGTT